MGNDPSDEGPTKETLSVQQRLRHMESDLEDLDSELNVQNLGVASLVRSYIASLQSHVQYLRRAMDPNFEANLPGLRGRLELAFAQAIMDSQPVLRCPVSRCNREIPMRRLTSGEFRVDNFTRHVKRRADKGHRDLGIFLAERNCRRCQEKFRSFQSLVAHFHGIGNRTCPYSSTFGK